MESSEITDLFQRFEAADVVQKPEDYFPDVSSENTRMTMAKGKCSPLSLAEPKEHHK